MIERKIGEIFEDKGVKLKVVEDKGKSFVTLCKNCYYYKKCCDENPDMLCLERERSDKMSVKYIRLN